MEDIMFGFRIIDTENGDQVIDRNLKTPYDALMPIQMVEYTEVDIQLAVMDGLKWKARSEAERRRKLLRNPIYRLACLCGLV